MTTEIVLFEQFVRVEDTAGETCARAGGASDVERTGGWQGRILVVDPRPDVRARLARELRSDGHEVLTADTGERAFFLLRNWDCPIDWLYSRASLPGLIDGWILADEYHESHPERAVIIAAQEARLSRQNNIILKETAPNEVLGSLRSIIHQAQATLPVAPLSLPEYRRAA